MPRTPVVPRRTVELALVGQIGIATFPAEPGAPSLGDIDALALDPECRLYALDRLTLRVHVFDPEGRQQRVCVPTLEDVVMLDEIARLSIGLDRSVFVSTHRRTIEFAPDGERRGVVGLGTDDAGRDLLVDPRNGDRWQIGYNALHRLGEDGQRTQTIRRRPDRRWLRRPDDACVADDGSIFVADRFEQSEAVEIHRYGRAGEPLQTFVVPSGFIGIGQSMASSQRWLVATVARGFELFDLVDGDVLFFERKARSKGLVQPMLGADGTELWLADLDGRTIYRHFLPESNR
jgi:hypothetical protein